MRTAVGPPLTPAFKLIAAFLLQLIHAGPDYGLCCWLSSHACIQANCRVSFSADPHGPGVCALLLALLSLLLVLATMPFSLYLCIKVIIAINITLDIFKLSNRSIAHGVDQEKHMGIKHSIIILPTVF
jgi:hypothetical protein